LGLESTAVDTVGYRGARGDGAVIGDPHRRRQRGGARHAEVVDGPRLLKDRHLKMALRQEGRVMRGIAWRAAEREAFVSQHRAAIDLAYSLEQDTWNGERYLQLSVADFRAPQS